MPVFCISTGAGGRRGAAGRGSDCGHARARAKLMSCLKFLKCPFIFKEMI